MSDGTRGPAGGSAPARLSALLGAVLDLPADERERWLDESSGGNAGLRAQLRELLRTAQADPARHHGDHTELLESSGSPHPGGAGFGSGGSGRGSGGDALPAATTGDRLVLGQQLGRYQVLDLLGAGGMGRVYRALDATLDREVAIKGLADAFRGDSRSLRRFEREARVLATLSHPNIAAIYGLERLNGSPYLVLERVDGETLAQRLVRGPVPIDEAIAIAVQIVAGLEEAHAKGVIHRDLKPSNVMLTPSRQVKLVDFGLAKSAAVRADKEESIEPITEVGLVVGTARYMSPEQVTGGDVDTRTDVWAFGCVLFEMLAAKPVFAGRSVSEVAAAVLRDEPDWTLLPAGLPRGVLRLIRRCLRRDPRARLQHIGDARIELDDLAQDVEASGVGAARPTRGRWLPWTLAAAAVAAAAVAAGMLVSRPTTGAPTPPVRLSLELPTPVTIANDYPAPFAIAPSGSVLVVEGVEGGQRRLYVRDLGSPALRRLAGTDGAHQPFFSTDGRWVGFFTARKVNKVPVEGGPVLEVADVGGNHRGATWASDGSIVFAASQTAGLLRVPARGGRPEALTTLDTARAEYSHRWPDAIPDRPWVLFTVGFEDATFDEGRIEAVSLETRERRVLVTGAGFARYLPGHGLLFVRGGRVYRVGFDPERIAVTGTPDVVVDAVRYDWRNGGSHLAVSAAGTIAYTPGEPVSHEYYLSWVGQDGRLTRAVDTPRRFRDLRRSADGTRIAISLGGSTESDLWVVDGNHTLSRLSFGLAPFRPTWTPDGRGITVGALEDGTWRLLTIPADGTGEPRPLLERPNRIYPDAWTPDGRHLVFQESSPETGWDLRVLEVDADGRPVGTPRTFAASPFHESNAAISPDGRWVAYESDELDGVVQVYVRAWPDGGGKVLASTAGARWPVWGAAGELYFWQTGEGSTLRVVRTRERDGQLSIGAAEPALADAVAPDVLRRVVVTTPNARYDLDPRTQRFLILEKAQPGNGPDLRAPVVVLGIDRPAARPAS